MIYVDRSSTALPEILYSGRVRIARDKIVSTINDRSSDHLAQLRIRFEPAIWAALKSDLVTLFKDKCAYCESLLSVTSAAEIDQFRPKQLSDREQGRTTNHYYSWLAYDWDNLLLACRSCNAGKAASFPVDGPRAHALASVEECRAIERGTLIDPCFDKPDGHFTYDETGACLPRTDRAERTIKLIGLNRPGLMTSRAIVNQRVKALCGELRSLTARTLGSKAHQVVRELLEMESSSAAYSAAAKAYISEEVADLPSSIQALLRGEGSGHAISLEPVVLTAIATLGPLPDIVNKPGRFRGKAMLPEHAMSSLTRVEISNFKAIEHIAFDIPLPSGDQAVDASAAVLLGENAAGKSTVLQAISLALLGTNNVKKLKLDGHRFLRHDSRWKPVRESTEVKLYFDDEKAKTVLFGVDHKTGQFHGSEELQSVVMGYGARRFFAGKQARRRHRATVEGRVRTLFDPRGTISNPTGWLATCDENNFNVAIRALREVLVLDDDAFVHRVESDIEDLPAVTIDVHGVSTPIEHLSEGYRTVVTTAVDVIHQLLRYWPDLEMARGIVLIDELETHLHPRWKVRILERLRNALPRVQFIVTTHDPLCLRGALDREVQVLTRSGNGAVELVPDLPNVRALSVEQILTSRYFGLLSTEDPSTEADMIRFTALAANSNRTADEDLELSFLREKIHQTVRIGQTPEEQLVFESAIAYVAQQRSKQADQEIGKEAKARMVEIWSSLKESDVQL